MTILKVIYFFSFINLLHRNLHLIVSSKQISLTYILEVAKSILLKCIILNANSNTGTVFLTEKKHGYMRKI